MTECALWFARYHRPDVSWHTDEQEAAYAAYYLIDSGGASVTGVQFPDGRTIKFGEWPLYDEIADRIVAEEKAQAGQVKRISTRRVRDPFGGQEADVDATLPTWVGESVTES